MGYCAPGCAPETVTGMTGAGCRIQTRPAGFDRTIWKVCSYIFTDITDLDEWATAIAAEKIIFTGRVLGQKPKGSPTKKKIASCPPERVTNYTRNWQWKDSNVDLTTQTEYDLYDTVDVNQDVLDIGFLSCDELFYGFFDAGTYSLDVDDTRTETNDDDAPMDVAVEIKKRRLTKPILLTGLSAVLTPVGS